MYTSRKKPQIHRTKPVSSHAKIDDSTFCLLLPLMIVASYFALSAVLRTVSNSGSRLDQIVCYAALIFFALLMLRGVRSLYQENKASKTERRRWAEGCKTALLRIVSRQAAASIWYEYSGRYFHRCNSLRLQMNSDQQVASPNQTIVEVEVSQHVYNRLKKRNTVRVYYMPESPLTFLLEDEL